MAQQSTEVTACNEFLEYIRYSLATETLSYHWLVTTKVESNVMTLTLKKKKSTLILLLSIWKKLNSLLILLLILNV